MRIATKSLLTVTLMGAFLAVATLATSPSRSQAAEQADSGGMMPGGSMMGHGGGSMMGEESGEMAGMMQQMSRMMKNCNEMMEAHNARKRDAGEADKPSG